MNIKIEIEVGAQKVTFEGGIEADTQTEERNYAVKRMIHLCNSVLWDDFEQNDSDSVLQELLAECLGD
jgi:hypothetical protein